MVMGLRWYDDQYTAGKVARRLTGVPQLPEAAMVMALLYAICIQSSVEGPAMTADHAALFDGRFERADMAKRCLPDALPPQHLPPMSPATAKPPIQHDDQHK